MPTKSRAFCATARGAWDYNTLIANIQAYLAQKGEWDPKGENSFAPALCNRIDRNTGGIVIAAKNAEALRILNDKIRDREIEKYYLCAVHGKPKQPRGRLENYLFKDAAKNQVYVKNRPEPGAKTAVTEYKPHQNLGRALAHGVPTAHRAHASDTRADGSCRHAASGRRKVRQRAVQQKFQAKKGGAFYSYKLEFAFPTDAGILEYLRGKCFTVESVEFAEKYFGISSLDGI